MNLIQAVLGKRMQQRAADWLDDRFFQVKELRPEGSSEGIPIDECLKNPTVFSCVRVRAEGVATLSRFLYRETKAGGREVVKRDPRNLMLSKFANPEMTRVDLELMLNFQDQMYGNAFAQIRRDEKFRPYELWPLPSRRMEVARDPKTGLLVYRYKLPDGSKKTMLEWEIHHRRGPSLDGILGLSTFELAMGSIQLGLSLEEYCNRVFQNDASPRGILTHKAKLSPESKDIIRKEWKMRHGGIANAGEIGILDMELDYKQVGMTNDVAQFVETYGKHREIICSWFRVPQHMVGILDRATFSNIAQQSQEFIRDTLIPDLERIELALMRDLLTQDEKAAGYFIEHVVEGMMRGDFGEQSDFMVKELLNGVRSVNEIRRWKNLNPVEGGDEHWKPMNIGILGQDTQNIPPQGQQMVDPQEPQETDENLPKNDQKAQKNVEKPAKRAEFRAFSPIIDDACRRILGREIAAFQREIKRAKTSKEFFDFCQEFTPQTLEFGEKALKPVLEVVGAATGALLRADETRINRAAMDFYKSELEKQLLADPGLPGLAKTTEERAATAAASLAEFLITTLEGAENDEAGL